MKLKEVKESMRKLKKVEKKREESETSRRLESSDCIEEEKKYYMR